jgi:HEAT repeat protein
MSMFPPSTITTEAALRDLASPRPRVRAAAAAALAECDPARRVEAAVALVAAVDDPDADVRAAAALSLGEIGGHEEVDLTDLGDGGPGAVEALVLRLDDGAPAVRQCAAVALGRMRAAAAIEPLRHALVDGPPDLRFQAATSLVEIDPAAAAGPLGAALADPDPEVVGAAALGLGAIGDPTAAEKLAPLLAHAVPRTRFDAAYALAELGDERAIPVLSTAATDRELGWDAIEALEAFGAPSAAALARIGADRGLDPEHRLRAAAALLAIAPDHSSAADARRWLLEPLRGWWRRRRGLAVELLGRVGGAWAVAPLEELRASPSGRRLGDEIGEALRRISERAR